MMEDIREAALAYYENGSEELRQLARELFDSPDVNGDGRVSVHEYIELFSERGCALINHSSFFQELDRDGNGGLDFDEFLTLYYILKSPRAFCDGCGIFLNGLYFTSIICFESSTAESFDLCSACFRPQKFQSPFLDNHTLLATKKPSAVPDTTDQAPSSGGRSFSPLPAEGSSTEVAKLLMSHEINNQLNLGIKKDKS